MTKKDYELIARAIKCSCDVNTNSTGRRIAQGLAFSLLGTNPRFNREKFLQACGVRGSQKGESCESCKEGIHGWCIQKGTPYCPCSCNA